MVIYVYRLITLSLLALFYSIFGRGVHVSESALFFFHCTRNQGRVDLQWWWLYMYQKGGDCRPPLKSSTMTYILFTKLQEIYINVKWKEYCNIGIKNCGQTRSSIAVILLRNTKLIPVQDTMLDYKYLVKETNAFHIHKSLFFYDFFLKYNVFQEIYIKVNWYTNYSSYLPNHYAMNVFCFYCT